MIQLLADICTGQTFLPDIFAGLHNIDKGIVTNPPDPCGLDLTNFGDIGLLLGNIVAAALQLAGLVAVALVIVGAFMYVTSNGDPAGIKRGKDTVVNSLLGLGVILIAFGAVKFITGQFQ